MDRMSMCLLFSTEWPLEHGLRSGLVDSFLAAPWHYQRHHPSYHTFVANHPHKGRLELDVTTAQEAETVARYLEKHSQQAVIGWQWPENESENGPENAEQGGDYYGLPSVSAQ